MGDICDMNDLERFMRCPEGKEWLEEIRQKLVGKRIQSVEFTNEVHHIGLRLHLEDGDGIELLHPELAVNVLRASHAEVLHREYCSDYPNRASP